MFKEGQELDIYRDNLAEEVKEAPKDERQKILDKEKETLEYQIARNKKIEARQNEEEINNGEGIFVNKKTLYHGSETPGIKDEGFEIWDDARNTVGEGVYFTSKAKDAFGYAHQRSGMGRGDFKGERYPVVYECAVENLKLIDLRKDENVLKIMSGWKDKLNNILKDPGTKNYVKQYIRDTIYAIKDRKIGSGNLLDAINSFDKAFSDYISSLGYDGLVTFEGGEIKNSGNHDSYVIFNPEKVKIIREQKIK